MSTENVNYDLELRSALEEALLGKWELIVKRKKIKRDSWGKLVKWLIEHEGIDRRLTDKRLISFCRRHARKGGEIEAWAGRKWEKKAKTLVPGNVNSRVSISGPDTKPKPEAVPHLGAGPNVIPTGPTNIPTVPKVGRRLTAELAREWREKALAEEEAERLKKIQSDKDWDLAGASGEGMFTEEEIARKRAWEAEQMRLGKPI